MLRAATYLAQSGIPADQITGIAALVQPAAFRAIAQAMHADGKPILEAAGETAQWTKFAYDIALKLVQAARRWVKLAPEALAEISAMQRRIKPRRGGLSERVQSTLAELMTDAERAELYALPWRAFEIADAMLRSGDAWRAAKLHETALALAIVLSHPLRAGDLAALDPVQHFIKDRRGRVTQIAVRTSKTNAVVRFEVEPDLAERIARHFTQFRPHIPGHDTMTALFPGENDRPREVQSLGRHLRRLVARQLGKRFTAHMARHLAVDISLDDDPSNIAVAQRLLGHRNPKVTLAVYGARATLAANRRFAAALREQAQRAGLPAPGERAPRRRKRGQ
jgi:integrase